MALEVVRAVRPWLDRAGFVNLNAVGEPLLAAGFSETLALTSEGPAKVSFNTNGLLHSVAEEQPRSQHVPVRLVAAGAS